MHHRSEKQWRLLSLILASLQGLDQVCASLKDASAFAQLAAIQRDLHHLFEMETYVHR